MKFQIINRVSGFKSFNTLGSHPSMIVEEDSQNDIGISQSFKYFSNNVLAVERPTEIDNSDIEGEHPG